MNKRGVELAASLVVTLIVCIIVFGLATGITYKLFCSADNKIASLDAQTERTLERKLSSGALVQVPDASKDAEGTASFCAGSSVPGASYALGIRNAATDDKDFTIQCVYNGYDTSLGRSDACDGQSAPFEMQHVATLNLPAGQSKSTLLVVNQLQDAPKGKHVFTVRVMDGGTVYGAAKVYLNLE